MIVLKSQKDIIENFKEWPQFPSAINEEILREILFSMFLIEANELTLSKIILLEKGESCPEINGMVPEEEEKHDNYSSKLFILDDYGNGIIVLEKS